MFQSEHLVEKWKPLLDHDGGIEDPHRRATTAVLLENQEKFLREEQAFNQGQNLMENPTNHANVAGAQGGFGTAGTNALGNAGFNSSLGNITMVLSTMTITNSAGFAETYNIYRTQYLVTGAYTLTVN